MKSAAPLVTLLLLFCVCGGATAASYESIKVGRVKGAPKVHPGSAAWQEIEAGAYAVLGDVSFCDTDELTAGKSAEDLRFQAQLERTALNFEGADKLYRCSLAVDPGFAQAWIEIADIIVHHADSEHLNLWADALAVFEYVKLINPGDAQAWNGAGISGSKLHNRKVMAENYGHLEKGDFAVTAQEWYILGEVQELNGFTYKETVINSYRKAVSLDPANSIYSAKLWGKLGQHGYRAHWSAFQQRLSARGKNHARFLERSQRPIVRTKLLGMANDAGDQAAIAGGVPEPAESSDATKLSRNGAFLDQERLAEIESRYKAMREAIVEQIDDETCALVSKTDSTSLLLRFLPMKRDLSREEHMTGQMYEREFADVFSASGLGFDRAPYGTRWDDKHFPLYLSLILQGACNVSCTAPIPRIATSAWQMDSSSIAEGVQYFASHKDQAQNSRATSATTKSSPYSAASLGGASVVRKTGTKDTSVNDADAFGMTAAHLAIIRGDILSFRALLQDPNFDPFTEDMFGNSPMSLLQRWHLQPEHEAMYEMVMQFLSNDSHDDAGAGGELQHSDSAELENAKQTNFLPVGVTVQNVSEHLDVDVADDDSSTESSWLSRRRTIPWGPLATWNPERTIEVLDPTVSSLADMIKNFIAAGRPVIVKDILRVCPEVKTMWERENLMQSELAELNASAFRVPYGEDGEANFAAPTMSMAEFAEQYMGVDTLTDDSEPRYVFQHHQQMHPIHNKRVGEMSMEPITAVLNCLPQELQDYLRLPPAGMPGAWTLWTVGMGSSGSGAPFHLHDLAANIVLKGTKRWFVYPPTYSTYSTQPIFEFLRDEYPTLPDHLKPIEFLQEPGDLVLLPGWWSHATVSVGDCLCISKVIDNNSGHPDQHNSWGPLRQVRFNAEDHKLVLNKFADVPLV